MFGEFDKNCKFAAHRTSKINEFSQPKLLAPVASIEFCIEVFLEKFKV